MDWRVFQFGFIFGVLISAYSEYSGATGFRTMSDLVAGGLLLGVLIEAAWFMIKMNYKLQTKAPKPHLRG